MCFDEVRGDLATYAADPMVQPGSGPIGPMAGVEPRGPDRANGPLTTWARYSPWKKRLPSRTGRPRHYVATTTILSLRRHRPRQIAVEAPVRTRSGPVVRSGRTGAGNKT